MMNSKYSYANKYFNFHTRSDIWRRLNKDEDIQRVFNACSNTIEYMSTHHLPHKLQREDIEHMEMELGKVEIALERIAQFPQMFSFTEDDKNKFDEQFKSMTDKVYQIDMQRISWD